VSEKTIGKWMRARKNRSQIVLGTKGAHPELDNMQQSRLSPQEITADLDSSLSNLQTEVIDLYWLHRDDTSRPVGEILETLNRAVLAGKIRYFGCSNWKTERIAAANAYAAEHHLQGFSANQMFWNLAKINPEGVADKTIAWMDDTMWAYHNKTGMAAIPYSAQAGGWFQKMALGNQKHINPGLRGMYDLPENHLRWQRAQQLRAELKLSLTQVVLGYLLSQPFVCVPIVGCQSPEQLRDSMSASGVRLPEDQVRFLVGEGTF